MNVQGAAESESATRIERLHREYGRLVLAYCLRRLSSREEAEDAAQIVFLNAHRSLEQGIEPVSEGAWLFKIAERAVLNRQRTNRRRARIEYPVDLDSMADVVVGTSPAFAETGGLRDALERIPEPQRRALFLREWQGLSYREVAAAMDISTAFVGTLLFRARRSLAHELGEPGSGIHRRLSRSLSPLLQLGWLFRGVALKAAAGGASVAVLAVAGHAIVPATGAAAASELVRPAPRPAVVRARASIPLRPAARLGRLRVETPAGAATANAPVPVGKHLTVPAEDEPPIGDAALPPTPAAEQGPAAESDPATPESAAGGPSSGPERVLTADDATTTEPGAAGRHCALGTATPTAAGCPAEPDSGAPDALGDSQPSGPAAGSRAPDGPPAGPNPPRAAGSPAAGEPAQTHVPSGEAVGHA